MAVFSSLPRELLVTLFETCPTIQTAIRLSQVNRETHTTWQKFSNQITAAILAPFMPAYEDAINLAKAEIDARSPSCELSESLWLPKLLQNEAQATRACSKFQAWLAQLPDNYRQKLSFTCLPTSYYMIRQILLARANSAAQNTLRLKIAAAPVESVRTHYELCWFMHGYMDREEKASQGMLKAEHDLPVGDGDSDSDDSDWTDIVPEWDFVLEFVRTALEKKLHGDALAAMRRPNLLSGSSDFQYMMAL